MTSLPLSPPNFRESGHLDGALSPARLHLYTLTLFAFSPFSLDAPSSLPLFSLCLTPQSHSLSLIFSPSHQGRDTPTLSLSPCFVTSAEPITSYTLSSLSRSPTLTSNPKAWSSNSAAMVDIGGDVEAWWYPDGHILPFSLFLLYLDSLDLWYTIYLSIFPI